MTQERKKADAAASKVKTSAGRSVAGSQAATVTRALELLQAQAADANIDKDDEFACDGSVKVSFMKANAAEMVPPSKDPRSAKGTKDLDGGGRK